MKKRVFERLKPRVLSLGFKEEDLESAVTVLAGNLAEEATDEDIDRAIEGIIPFLEVSQKAATRIVNANKSKPTTPPTETKPATGGAEQTDPNQTGAAPQQPDIKKLIDEALKPYTERFDNFFQDNQRQSHQEMLRQRFIAANVDADYFEAAIEGRTFGSDEELDTFATALEKRWGEYSQKLANDGLTRFTQPVGGGKKKEGADAIADFITKGTEKIVEQTKK